MALADYIRKLTGMGGEREFLDITGRAGTTTIRRPGGLPTVFAIHGFTGVPGEVGLCCDAASDLGLASVAPVLAGHGHTARELSRTTYPDWLQSVRGDFDVARKRGPVIVVGLSLGSLIATELTLSAPGDVAGLALLSNAFWLKGPHPRLSLKFARHVRFPPFYIDKKRSDIGSPEGLAEHVSLDSQPLKSAISLEMAGTRLREELFRVHRPTLILHGARDSVCPVDNAWKAAQRLGTTDCRVVILPRSKHVITRDVERHRVHQELLTFFERCAAGARPWADASS